MTPMVLNIVAKYLSEKQILTRSRFTFIMGVIVANSLIPRIIGINKFTWSDTTTFILGGMLGLILPVSILWMIRMGYKQFNPNWSKELPCQKSAKVKEVLSALILYFHALWLTIVFLLSLLFFLGILICPYLEPAKF